ncbi:beta-galactoside-binding lectin [Aphelenchoides avenae]|nr:beta-galactoside-binding lectin [Aphelenchus avenae]
MAAQTPTVTDFDKTRTPFTTKLCGFYPGDRIRLIVTPVLPRRYNESLSFNIDLRHEAIRNVLFHFKARFSENIVAMNSTILKPCGIKWRDEVRPKGFPFKQDQAATLDIIAETNAIRVNVDEKEFTTFKARDDMRLVGHLIVEGDVDIERITVTSNHAVESLTPVDYGKVPTPFSAPRRGFNPGDRIRVVVTPLKGQHGRFNIDLRCDTNQDIVFHFNPRFGAGKVVMNSRNNGRWGDEVCPKEFPFNLDQKVIIDFTGEPSAISVSVDEKLFTSYRVRSILRLVDSIMIEGEVEIHEVHL